MTPAQGTILVVEDNPITRKMVRITLESAGYRVQEAANARSALAQFRQRVPDLVIQDVVLPDMDGLDLVRQLRATPDGASVPIIAFSGFLSRMEQARVDAVGFTDYLFKPVEPSRILETVRAHLASESAAVEPVGRRRKVLIADDEPITLKLLKIRLEQLDFDVDVASDGTKALAAARRHPPDAIISDVLMPGLDGFRLCAAIKKDRRLARIPVILTSSTFQEAEDERVAREAGATAFVLRTPDFKGVIDALLKASKSKAPAKTGRVAASTGERYTHRVIRQLERQVAQNAELTRRLGQREAELSLIASLQALDTTPDVGTVANELLARALDAAAVSKGIVYLLDARGQLTLHAQLGYGRGDADGLATFFGREDLLRECLERGEVLEIPSATFPDERAAELLRLSKTQGLVVAPIMKASDRFGVLVAGTGGRRPAAEWVEFLSSTVSQVAQALFVTRAFARVAAAEKQYRSLFDNALYGIFQSTPDGRLLTANRALARILGYATPAELVATVNDLGTQVYADPAGRAEFVRTIRERGIVSQFETTIRRRDGSLAWISETAQAIRDETGALVRIDGAIEDITERRQAEATTAALAELSRTLSRSIDPEVVGRLVTESVCRLLSATSAGIYRLEAESKSLVLDTLTVSHSSPEALYWAPHLPETAGLTAVALRERRPVATPDALADSRVYYTPETRERLVPSSGRALLAAPLVARDRVFGALVVSAGTGRIYSDEEIALVQTFADQAAQALENARLYDEARHARDFLESIARNSVDAIVTTDVEGRVTYFSPGAERMFGYGAGEAIGRPAGDFYEAGPDEPRALSERLLAEEQIAVYETTLRRKDGRPFVVHSSISVMRDASGVVIGTIAVARDMTESKRLEAHLRQSEKLSAMGTLLAGVAHELNNPLSVVAGHAQLLKQAATDAPIAERAGKIAAAVERCARIVKNFLALARQAPPERTRVDLNGVVREVVELLSYSLRVDGIQMTLDLSPDLPPLSADAHQLQQVLINLITNAHHALRDVTSDRRISVTSRFDAAAHTVLLQIADTGLGIPPELHARIFEPFFTTKPSGQGTGLGLALCQSMVAEHDGTLDVQSEPGRGATFSIRLPVITPAVRPPRATVPGPRPAPRGAILVVDDEPEVASLLAELLSAAGHEVETASNGMVALDKLEERAYDVVISDLRMPGLDGPGFFREVERRQPWLASRFIFLTGDALGDETRAFLETSRAPRINKPFSVDEMLATLADVLAGPGRP